MEYLKTDLSLRAEIDLYYDLFVPESAAGPSPLLVAVHGYGAHKRYMMREARRVARDDFVIASLQGPHQHFRRTDDGDYRVGFGWLTDHRPEEYVRLHHEFIDRVVDLLAADGLADRSRVFLLGFSQACALNFRYAFSHPEALAGVVGICGGIPGDLDTNADYRDPSASVFYLYGDEDEFYPPEKFAAFDRRLAERVADYRSKKYCAAHEMTDEMRADIRDFLAAAIST